MCWGTIFKGVIKTEHFEAVCRRFSVAAIIIMLIAALAAGVYISASKAKRNIPETAVLMSFENKTGIYMPVIVNSQ